MIYQNIETLTGVNFGMNSNTYNFSKRLLHIDSTHRCPLECPKCQRQSLKKLGIKIPGRDMPWNDFIKITKFFKKGLIFCGNISDPIFHPKFIQILKYCYEHKIPSGLNTAASQKPIEWYKKAFEANPKTLWIFGVDGLPKDSYKYRIHQDGPKLFEVMKMGSKMGNNIRWQYIVFNYNENNIEEARQLAKDNGIQFDVIHSGRWEEKDPYKPKNPNYYLNSKRDKFYQDYKRAMQQKLKNAKS